MFNYLLKNFMSLNYIPKNFGLQKYLNQFKLEKLLGEEISLSDPLSKKYYL